MNKMFTGIIKSYRKELKSYSLQSVVINKNESSIAFIFSKERRNEITEVYVCM